MCGTREALVNWRASIQTEETSFNRGIFTAAQEVLQDQMQLFVDKAWALRHTKKQQLPQRQRDHQSTQIAERPLTHPETTAVVGHLVLGPDTGECWRRRVVYLGWKSVGAKLFFLEGGVLMTRVYHWKIILIPGVVGHSPDQQYKIDLVNFCTACTLV